MFLNGVYSVLLLIASNIFMIIAWYGHLKLKEDYPWFAAMPVIVVILFSWCLAFFEYCLQVPANRIGFIGSGGPFDIMQLKIIQEVITLTVFIIFSILAFKLQLKWNHIVACLCMVAAVYFVFKK